MASPRQALDTVTGWLKTITNFGVGLIMALVVIDILFPDSTYVIENIGRIVGQFSEQGLAGLIALLLFLLLFRLLGGGG